MNTGGSRRQQQAPHSRLAATLLILGPRPDAVGQEDDLARLPGPGPTAALARRASPDLPAAPSRVHRECCLSKAQS